jgi:hypothetical protein
MATATKDDKPQALSPLYYIDGTGFMARLYTDGWHCTCYKPGCEHVEQAKKMHQEALRQAQDATGGAKAEVKPETPSA